MSFAFTPATGLNDIATYPTTPASEAAARQQVMDPLNQIRDYMNNSLATKVSGAAQWISPTLLNSWISYGSGWAPASYYKDDLGIVRIRGLVKSGTITAAFFTLPAGYRPASNEMFATVCRTGGTTYAVTDIAVQTDGTIVPINVPYNEFVVLSGISFRAEQ